MPGQQTDTICSRAPLGKTDPRCLEVPQHAAARSDHRQHGPPLSRHLTSHVLRRTVATHLAEFLGDEGDKLIKRVLGHSDGSVTAIYNRYRYVKEMRRTLETWANELTAEAAPEHQFA